MEDAQTSQALHRGSSVRSRTSNDKVCQWLGEGATRDEERGQALEDGEVKKGERTDKQLSKERGGLSR